MVIKEQIERLEKSDEFKNWKNDNPESFLAHVFKMLDDANQDLWQVGYYSKKTDKVTTFMIHEDGISVVPEQDVFKKPGTTVSELKLDDVSVSFEDADKKSKEVLEENFPKHKPLKKIMILQNIKDDGQVWNVTFFTGTPTIVNIKIKADDVDNVDFNELNLVDPKY